MFVLGKLQNDPFLVPVSCFIFRKIFLDSISEDFSDFHWKFSKERNQTPHELTHDVLSYHDS